MAREILGLQENESFNLKKKTFILKPDEVAESAHIQLFCSELEEDTSKRSPWEKSKCNDSGMKCHRDIIIFFTVSRQVIKKTSFQIA